MTRHDTKKRRDDPVQTMVNEAVLSNEASDVSTPPRSQISIYAVVLFTVCMALMVTLQIELVATKTPFALFFAAVIISTWYGGWKAGLCTIALSTLLSDYFIIPPHYSLRPTGTSLAQLGTFFVVALLIIWLAAARDRSELSLHESEERFRIMAETAYDAIITIDSQHRILFFNRAAEKMFGCRYNDVRGSQLNKLIRDGPRSDRVGQVGATYGQRANGEEFPVEASMSQTEIRGRKLFTVILRDITERKRVEQVARESDERLHTVLESLTEGLVIADSDGQLIHWNRAALEMHGFSSMEECLLKLPEFQNIFELSNLDGRVLRLEEWPLARVIAGETLVDYEVSLRALDRNWRGLFSFGGAIVKEPNGRQLAFVSITDITKRKQAEEDLRRSERQLSGIISSAMDAVITVDDEQRIVLFNDAAERMFLFPAEDAIGQPLDRFIPERFREAHKDHIKNFGQTQVSRRAMGALGALYGLRRDGEEFPIEASISQIESDGKRLYTVILRDVTERRRAEESIREQARILDLAPVMIRDLSGRILFWNSGVEKMYGWKAEEALEKISHKLLKTEFPRPLEEIKMRLLADGHWEGEVVHTRKDGQRVEVASYWVLHRDEHDKPKAVLVVNNDITERRQAEREIRRLNEELEQRVAERTAQLKAANQELEAFSYSVSHDLRAPLRHINGFSQALLEDYQDRLDDGGKEYLQEVRSASQEMAKLIDDLLQLARVTRGEMRNEEVNLSELARSVIDELQKLNGKRNVTIEIGEGLKARGDKRLLRVMLTNLLGNAWKFTSRRKQAEVIFGQVNENGEGVYFVRDNGAGFDMNYANKLFGAFQRLHTGGEFEGTGIGLATVQRIINRHGGHVWAEGVVDGGATFYFTLPNSKETGDGKQSDSTG